MQKTYFSINIQTKVTKRTRVHIAINIQTKVTK